MTADTSLFCALHSQITLHTLEKVLDKSAYTAFINSVFASILARLCCPDELLWYLAFVAQTKSSSDIAWVSDGAMPDDDTSIFWQKPFHVALADELSQQFLVDKARVQALLPLLAHRLFDFIGTEQISIQTAIDNNKADIVANLPSWIMPYLTDKTKQYLAITTHTHNTLDELIDNALNDQSDHFDGAAVFANTANTDDNNSHADSIYATDSSHTADNSHINNNTNTTNNSPESLTAFSTTVTTSSATTTSHSRPPKPTVKPNFVKPLAVLLFVLVGAGGFWYYHHVSTTKEEIVNANQALTDEPLTPAIQALPPTLIRLTVGEQGSLYACHAELASTDMADKLLSLLQDNFAQTACVIDINSQANQEIAGFDRLASVLGILKTARFASIELGGAAVYVNAPNADDIERLVRDIGALLGTSGISVLAMPTLDKNALIHASLQRAQQALDNLPQNASDYELARTMSLQIIDVGDGTIAQANLDLLSAFAKRLQERNTQLIIVAHSDTSKGRADTQHIAELIKSALVNKGVSETQLVAQGVGANFPMADNETPIGRFYNNRIEFLVYDEATMQALNQAPLGQDMPAGEPLLADQIPSYQDPTMNPNPSQEPSGDYPLPNQPNTPTFDVQNGQIVQIPPPALPPPPIVQPFNSPASSGIPEDLLSPIGSDNPSGSPALQVH